MRKLVCIGWGNIPRYMKGKLMPYETKEIDEEVVRLTEKKNPNFLFISLGSYHPEEYYEGIHKVYSALGCSVSHLNAEKPYDELEEEIQNADIIYLGAGETPLLFQRLKEKGLDRLLVKAYEKGKVCVGMSAGTYFWFKYTYSLLEGMGIIDGICCAHYNEKKEPAKKQFYDAIKEKKLPGYALENCTALEFLDDDMRVIKSNPIYSVYRITYSKDEFHIEQL